MTATHCILDLTAGLSRVATFAGLRDLDIAAEDENGFNVLFMTLEAK